MLIDKYGGCLGFVPRWGRNHRVEERNKNFMEMKG